MKRFTLFFVLMVALSLTMSVNGSYAFSQSSASPEMGAAPGESSLSGKVVETMSSGGYTYVNIEKNGNMTWVAVPNIKVSVGQEIAFQPGMVMANFTSKSLGRTFDTIVFSTGLAGRQGMSSGHGDSSRAPTVAASDDAPIKVDKASGPDAYTVSELYEKVDALDKKTVVFKGRVVKFSPKIMNMNWVHIQDGSGDASKGTNDILATTLEEVSVGDVVTAKGTLAKDKDFGSGYKYAVIVEETRFSK